MNSPAQDFYIHDSWCGLFDHICDEVVFIPGAFRFKGRSTLSSGKNEFKTLLGCQSSSVLSVFLLFLDVQKRHSTESQACQDGFDKGRIAAVPTAFSVPVQRGLSDQACRSLCSALATCYNRGQVDCHCLLCQGVKSTVLTPTMCP